MTPNRIDCKRHGTTWSAGTVCYLCEEQRLRRGYWERFEVAEARLTERLKDDPEAAQDLKTILDALE